MKAPLLVALNLNPRGLEPLERLAVLIVLGIELRHLKRKLGYIGVGSHHQYRGEIRPTWNRFCQGQCGFSDDTAANLFDSVSGVKARLEASAAAEAREILAMMEIPPSELSDAERQKLVNGIRLYALKDGDTQKILKQKFREAAAPDDPEGQQPSAAECGEQAAREMKLGRMVARMIDDTTGRDDSEDWTNENMTALAMSFGLGEKRAREVARALRARELAGLAMRALRNKQNGGGL